MIDRKKPSARMRVESRESERDKPRLGLIPAVLPWRRTWRRCTIVIIERIRTRVVSRGGQVSVNGQSEPRRTRMKLAHHMSVLLYPQNRLSFSKAPQSSSRRENRLKLTHKSALLRMSPVHRSHHHHRLLLEVVRHSAVLDDGGWLLGNRTCCKRAGAGRACGCDPGGRETMGLLWISSGFRGQV